jgi:hypothetical protein
MQIPKTGERVFVNECEGRPAAALKAATKPTKKKAKRNLSPEGRARIAAAVKAC